MLRVAKSIQLIGPLENNGFSFENLSATKTQDAIGCMSYLAGIRDAGAVNCQFMREHFKTEFIDKKKLKIISNLSTNTNADIDQLITSFTNYAENNTDKWKESPAFYARLFLYRKFPCKLD